jgi:uncharacterized protein (TIGR02145 family)
MKKLLHFYKIIIISTSIGSQSIFAQIKIGDNPTNMNASSLLELEATNKGLLIPRLTTTQRDAISNPAVGLLLFNTTTNCFNFYKGSNWFEMCGAEIPLPAALGSTFTSYTNSINENFSANTSCQNKLISAGYSSVSCSGNVIVGANTYPVVFINGQCWMQTNLKEAPTILCGAAINTGCNIWSNTSPGDIGSWGYYNNTTTNGTAGWRTTEPKANAGLLYQWSAAMNGSTTERAQGVCPIGWHIPSDCEWMYLEHGQGMSIPQQTNNNWRNTTNEGNKLRSEGLGATNTSGFTALLVGYRGDNGGFVALNSSTFLWLSTEVNATTAQRRVMASNNAGINRDTNTKAHGFTIRCLRD